jgi:hypothetical protein
VTGTLAKPDEATYHFNDDSLGKPQSVGLVCECGQAVAISVGIVASCSRCARAWLISASCIRGAA